MFGFIRKKRGKKPESFMHLDVYAIVVSAVIPVLIPESSKGCSESGEGSEVVKKYDKSICTEEY